MHAQASTRYAKAFQNGNQFGPFGQAPYVLAHPSALPDGFIVCGAGGAITHDAIAFLPYAQAAAGTLISVRLIYWNDLGATPTLLVGSPLVEALYSVSNLAGLDPRAAVTDSERFCESIAVTAGSLGVKGINAGFGSGTDLLGLTVCEIHGARWVSFDVQATDPAGNVLTDVGMNVLWAKCH